MAYPAITEWAGRLFRKQLTAALDAIDGGGALTKVDKAGDTMTGTLVTAAPSISAGLRLQPAGADPSSPVDGDVWTTTTGVFARVNGATVQLDAAGGGGNPALSWVV